MENTKKRKYRIFGNVWGNFRGTTSNVFVNGFCVNMYQINENKYLLLPERHTCNSTKIFKTHARYFDSKSEMHEFVDRYSKGNVYDEAQPLLNLLEVMDVCSSGN